VTTVGHSLTGLSIAVLTLPQGRSLMWYLLVGHFFVFFANVPDFPLSGWGHASYQVSHSVFVTAMLAAGLALLLLSIPQFRNGVGGRIVFYWCIAWFSHLVLDSMYNHGDGIGILWPFSDAHLVLPVPWFETLTWPPFTAHNRNVFLIELGVYGTVFSLCLLLRRKLHVTDQRAETP